MDAHDSCEGAGAGGSLNTRLTPPRRAKCGPLSRPRSTADAFSVRALCGLLFHIVVGGEQLRASRIRRSTQRNPVTHASSLGYYLAPRARFYAEMKLIYIDEAGNTGTKADPDQPIHMIGALIVDQSKIRSIELRLNALAEVCVEKLSEAGQTASADQIEFHGAEIFSGKKVFAHIKPGDRVEICSDLIEICKAEEAVFGSCSINKMKLWGGHPHLRCFQFTLERIQDYLMAVDDLGLLVADEHRELEEEILRDLAFSKHVSTQWGWRPTTIKNVVDTVHFVKSKHNRLVQACDVLTYFRLKGERLEDKLRHAWWASNPMKDGKLDPTFADYQDANTKPAEKAVLAFNKAIKGFERFRKLWPQ